MRECDIRSELLDMSLSILQDRDVLHTCFTERVTCEQPKFCLSTVLFEKMPFCFKSCAVV